MTLKPTTPLRAPEQQPLKPASPLHPTTAAKTPISHPQRRWRFQSHTSTSEQRRRWFQTTGLPRLQHPNAVPVSGGGAWPDNEPTRRATDQRPRPTGVEGAGGPGCGARGWRRGLAGQRADAPSRRSATTPHRCGGRRRPWLRCPWAAAGPGRASTATRPHWCGGRRRDRRARAGFEARRRTK